MAVCRKGNHFIATWTNWNSSLWQWRDSNPRQIGIWGEDGHARLTFSLPKLVRLRMKSIFLHCQHLLHTPFCSNYVDFRILRNVRISGNSMTLQHGDVILWQCVLQFHGLCSMFRSAFLVVSFSTSKMRDFKIGYFDDFACFRILLSDVLTVFLNVFSPSAWVESWVNNCNNIPL